MNVLLISANTLTMPCPVYPIGLDYVAGAICTTHKVRIVDMNLTDSPVPEIEGFQPDILGISIRNIDNTDCHDPRGFIGQYQDLMEQIRGATDSPVVLGGSGFTLFPVELMNALDADFGIVGEGERLQLLLETIEAGNDPATIPGVLTRHGLGNGVMPWQGPMDRAIDPEYPHLNYYVRHGGILNLQTRRGCPYRCIYCTYPRIEGRKLRNMDPIQVARNAKRLQDAGARYLFITDSAFNADYEHSMAVAREFIRAGVSIPWGAFLAPTQPPDSYFQLLADAGMTHVEFGTESLCDLMLTNYQKPFRSREVFLSHDMARAQGLHVAHYFLLGGPGENRSTVLETLDKVDKLDQTVLFFFCGVRVYPNTKLHRIARTLGQIRDSQNLLKPFFFQCDIDNREIMDLVDRQGAGKINWVVGAGGQEMERVLKRLYSRGRTGPLWEYLVR